MLQNVMIGGTIEGGATLRRNAARRCRATAATRRCCAATALLALARRRAGSAGRGARRPAAAQRIALHRDRPRADAATRPSCCSTSRRPGCRRDEIQRLGALIKAISRRGTGVLLVEHHADLIFDICDQRDRAQSRPRAGRRNAGRDPRRTRRWSVPISAAEPLLVCARRCNAGYGKIGVLHGVDITVGGRRGGGAARPQRRRQDHAAARLSGLLPWTAGSVRFDGRDLRGAGPRETARAGLVHVIEGHRVFTQIIRHRQSAARRLRPAARRARRADRGGACRSFPKSPPSAHDRGGALSRRAAADAGGGARAGAPAAAADAGRAVGRACRRCWSIACSPWSRGCARPAPPCCWSSS